MTYYPRDQFQTRPVECDPTSMFCEMEHYATCPQCRNEFFYSPFTEEGAWTGKDNSMRMQCPKCGAREVSLPVHADLNDTEYTMIMIDLARYASFKSLQVGDKSEFARKLLNWWSELDDITKEGLEELARECACEELL